MVIMLGRLMVQQGKNEKDRMKVEEELKRRAAASLYMLKPHAHTHREHESKLNEPSHSN